MSISRDLKFVTGWSEEDEVQTLPEKRVLHLRERKLGRNGNKRLKWGGAYELDMQEAVVGWEHREEKCVESVEVVGLR